MVFIHSLKSLLPQSEVVTREPPLSVPPQGQSQQLEDSPSTHPSHISIKSSRTQEGVDDTQGCKPEGGADSSDSDWSSREDDQDTIEYFPSSEEQSVSHKPTGLGQSFSTTTEQHPLPPSLNLPSMLIQRTSATLSSHPFKLDITPTPPSSASVSESVATCGSLQQTPLELSLDSNTGEKAEEFAEGIKTIVPADSHEDLRPTDMPSDIIDVELIYSASQTSQTSNENDDQQVDPQQPHSPTLVVTEQLLQDTTNVSPGSVDSHSAQWQLTLDSSTCTESEGDTTTIATTEVDSTAGKNEPGVASRERDLATTPDSKRRKLKSCVDKELTPVSRIEHHDPSSRRLFCEPDIVEMPLCRPQELFIDLTQEDSDEEQYCSQPTHHSHRYSASIPSTSANVGVTCLTCVSDSRAQLDRDTEHHAAPSSPSNASNTSATHTLPHSVVTAQSSESLAASEISDPQDSPSALGELQASLQHEHSLRDSQASSAGSCAAGLGSPLFLPPTPGREDVETILGRKSIAFS